MEKAMVEIKKNVAAIKQKEVAIREEKEATRKALLEVGQDVVAELADIGFEYMLVPVGEKNGHTCSICGEVGHSKRTCSKAVANGVV